WSWYNDGYNYYRNFRSFIFQNQPIRPLVPIISRTIKWKGTPTIDSKIVSTKKAEISPILIGRSIKKIILKKTEKNVRDLELNLKILLRFCNKSKNKEKMCFLNGVFKETGAISIQDSDIITIIETDPQTYKNLDFTNQKISRIYYGGIDLLVHDMKKVYVIYKEKPPKVLRKRIEKIVSLFFSLKFLIQRATYLLRTDLLENMGIRDVSNILEYFLSSLNPSIYSSQNIPNLLPKHYQRMLFKSLCNKMNILNNFSYLLEKIKKKILDMPAYEASFFFRKKNIFTNDLRDKVILTLAEEPEPELTEKDRLMLDFFVYQYKKELEDDALYDFKVRRKKALGSMSRHFIRTNINLWLEVKGFPTNTFTDNELKKTPVADVFSRLIKKDLIVIDQMEKGKTDFHLSLKEENKFIVKLLL
ncbi:MAG: hypothetical protein KAS52_06885, partial [Candidatus Heimdallarchaeota archaeon]|nr:hypothetical protein [Candidatus Heimdallarchaeota archaeon]